MRMILRCGYLCLCLTLPLMADASPPVPDDLSLSVRVVTTTDPEFRPGTHAVVSFKVGHHGPTDRTGGTFFVSNATVIPDGPNQPIRLTPAVESACAFSGVENQQAWFYVLAGTLPQLNEPIECPVNLDVLDGAIGGLLVTFTVVIMDPEDGYDPILGNSSVTFSVGYSAAQPSPFSMPFVAPAEPTIADNVKWAAQWDGCGVLGTPTVTSFGDQIDVRYPIQRICGVPISGSGMADLGRLPAGHYTVHAEPCDVGFFGFDGPCWLTEPPTDLEFDVAGGSPADHAEVPTLGWGSELALALAALLMAVRSLLSRRRSARLRNR
jgi:hypothetical protein